MKIQMIELNKLDELLIDYNTFAHQDESFSEFIRVSKCLFNEEPALFDWVEVEEENIIEVREDD